MQVRNFAKFFGKKIKTFILSLMCFFLIFTSFPKNAYADNVNIMLSRYWLDNIDTTKSYSAGLSANLENYFIDVFANDEEFNIYYSDGNSINMGSNYYPQRFVAKAYYNKWALDNYSSWGIDENTLYAKYNQNKNNNDPIVTFLKSIPSRDQLINKTPSELISIQAGIESMIRGIVENDATFKQIHGFVDPNYGSDEYHFIWYDPSEIFKKLCYYNYIACTDCPNLSDYGFALRNIDDTNPYNNKTMYNENLYYVLPITFNFFRNDIPGYIDIISRVVETGGYYSLSNLIEDYRIFNTEILPRDYDQALIMNDYNFNAVTSLENDNVQVGILDNIMTRRIYPIYGIQNISPMQKVSDPFILPRTYTILSATNETNPSLSSYGGFTVTHGIGPITPGGEDYDLYYLNMLPGTTAGRWKLTIAADAPSFIYPKEMLGGLVDRKFYKATRRTHDYYVNVGITKQNGYINIASDTLASIKDYPALIAGKNFNLNMTVTDSPYLASDIKYNIVSVKQKKLGSVYDRTSNNYFSLANCTNGSQTLKVSSSIETGVNVSYDITFNITGHDSRPAAYYNDSASNNITLNVSFYDDTNTIYFDSSHEEYTFTYNPNEINFTQTFNKPIDAIGTVNYSIKSQSLNNVAQTACSYFSIANSRVNTLTINGNIKPGEYVVEIKADAQGSQKYKAGSATKKIYITVNKKMLKDVICPSAKLYSVYNGSDIQLIEPGESITHATWLFYSSTTEGHPESSSAYTNTIPTGKLPGNYYVYYMLDYDNNYYTSSTDIKGNFTTNIGYPPVSNGNVSITVKNSLATGEHADEVLFSSTKNGYFFIDNSTFVATIGIPNILDLESDDLSLDIISPASQTIKTYLNSEYIKLKTFSLVRIAISNNGKRYNAVLTTIDNTAQLFCEGFDINQEVKIDIELVATFTVTVPTVVEYEKDYDLHPYTQFDHLYYLAKATSSDSGLKAVYFSLGGNIENTIQPGTYSNYYSLYKGFSWSDGSTDEFVVTYTINRVFRDFDYRITPHTVTVNKTQDVKALDVELIPDASFLGDYLNFDIVSVADQRGRPYTDKFYISGNSIWVKANTPNGNYTVTIKAWSSENMFYSGKEIYIEQEVEVLGVYGEIMYDADGVINLYYDYSPDEDILLEFTPVETSDYDMVWYEIAEGSVEDYRSENDITEEYIQVPQEGQEDVHFSSVFYLKAGASATVYDLVDEEGEPLDPIPHYLKLYIDLYDSEGIYTTKRIIYNIYIYINKLENPATFNPCDEDGISSRHDTGIDSGEDFVEYSFFEPTLSEDEEVTYELDSDNTDYPIFYALYENGAISMPDPSEPKVLISSYINEAEIDVPIIAHLSGNDVYKKKDLVSVAHFSVVRATPAFVEDGEPKIKTDLVYNAKVQDLIENGTTTSEHTSIYYCVTNDEEMPSKDIFSEYSANKPVARSAGTYYVWYYIKGDDYYDDSDIFETPLVVTIDKSNDYSVTTTDGSATYSGALTDGGASISFASSLVDDNSVTDNIGETTIKYKTTEDGEFDLDFMPKFDSAGTHKVFFQITPRYNYAQYTGYVTITIAPYDISDLSISFDDYDDFEGEYHIDILKDSLGLMALNKTLVCDEDFEIIHVENEPLIVSPYSAQQNVTINGIGNFTGSFDFSYIEKRKEYDVNFDYNNGTGTAIFDHSYYGVDYVLPDSLDATREHYNLVGYAFVKDATDEDIYVTPAPLNESKTFYAIWQEEEYSCIFYDSDGEEVLKSTNLKYGTIIDNHAPTVEDKLDTYAILTFDGWYDAPVGGSKVDVLGPIEHDVEFYAHYTTTRRLYYATYKNETGDATYFTVDAGYGEIAAPLYNPSKEPSLTSVYNFDGWYDALEGGNKITSFNITEDVTYYARFSEYPRTYTFTFYDSDGVIFRTISKQYGEDITPPANPSKNSSESSYYVFDGWYTTQDDSGVKVTDFGVATGSCNYYARFIEMPVLYIINFLDDNSNIISHQEIPYYEDIIVPEDPTKESTESKVFEFIGWFSSKTSGIEVTEFGKAVRNMDVFARFKSSPRKYTITFIDEDDSFISDGLFQYDSYPIPPSVPSKPDEDENYEYAVTSWTPEFVKVHEDATYKAVYTRRRIPTTHTVTITISEGNTHNVNVFENIPYGTSITIDGDLLCFDNYTFTPTIQVEDSPYYEYEFGGWNDVPEMVTGDLSIEASFIRVPRVYEIEYRDQLTGETIEGLTPNEYTYGVGATLPSIEEKEGYVIEGWRLSNESGDYNPGNPIVTGIDFTAVGNKICYACYKKETYRITFKNFEGSNLPSNLAHGFTYDVDRLADGPLEAPVISKTGYTFLGWKVEGGSDEYISSITDTSLGDVTLVACWKALEFNVIYNTGHNSLSYDDATICYGDTFGDLVFTPSDDDILNFVGDAIEFDGWYLEQDFTGGKLTSNTLIDFIPNDNVINLYAKWNILPDSCLIDVISLSESLKAIAGSGNIEGVPLGGRVRLNREYTFTAHDNELYEFVRWEIGENTYTGNTLTYTFTSDADTLIKAIYKYVGQVGVSLKVEGDKPFSVKIDNTTYDATLSDNKYRINKLVSPLSPISLIYDGDDLSCWVNGSNVVVSTDNEYITKIFADSSFKLLTRNSSDASYYYEFRDQNNKILAFGVADSSDTLKASTPNNPTKTGYTFSGWKLSDGSNLNELTDENIASKVQNGVILLEPIYIYSPSYVNVKLYLVTDDSFKTYKDEQILIGSSMLYTAPIIPNYTFLYWATGNMLNYDDEILNSDKVSTSKDLNIYTYARDQRYYAVYSNKYDHQDYPTVHVPTIAADVVGDAHKMFIQVSRNIPEEGFELLEHGLLYTTQQPESADDIEKNLQFAEEYDPIRGITLKPNVKIARSSLTTKIGGSNYRINCTGHESSWIMFRGYIIVNEHGNIRTKYTDVYLTNYDHLTGNSPIIGRFTTSTLNPEDTVSEHQQGEIEW